MGQGQRYRKAGTAFDLHITDMNFQEAHMIPQTLPGFILKDRAEIKSDDDPVHPPTNSPKVQFISFRMTKSGHLKYSTSIIINSVYLKIA